MPKRLKVKFSFFIGTQLINIVDGKEVPLAQLTAYDIELVTVEFPRVIERTTGLRTVVETEMLDD